MFDVAIIGGGPAGLSAALYLARADASVVVLDSDAPRHGIAEAIHSLLTHDGRSPSEFRRLANVDLDRYGKRVRREHGEAVAIEGESNAFVVRTAAGERYEARRVLLATGVRDVLPEVPGMQEAWATSVHHCPWCWGIEAEGRRMGFVFDHVSGAVPTLAIGRLAGEVHGFWHGEGEIPATCARSSTARVSRSTRGGSASSMSTESSSAPSTWTRSTSRSTSCSSIRTRSSSSRAAQRTAPAEPTE